MILLASVLLALGNPLRNWLNRKDSLNNVKFGLVILSAIAIFVAAVYGGYFGAGMSVIFLAVLGVFINDSITHLNALKQILALATNVAAAIFFVFSGNVNWVVAGVMAGFAIAGGVLGVSWQVRLVQTDCVG